MFLASLPTEEEVITEVEGAFLAAKYKTLGKANIGMLFGRTRRKPRKLAPTTISLKERAKVLDVLESVTEARDVDASPSALTSTLADSVQNLANLVAGQVVRIWSAAPF
jgi:hypothetical protein